MSTQNERELLVSVNEVRSLVIPKSTEDWAVKKAFEQFKHLKSLNMGEWDAFEDAMITLRNEFMKSRNPVLPSLTDIVISQLSEDQSRIDALSKDADNLTKLLIEARDDVCECLNSDYLHAGWPRYDKRILFRHLHLSAIDAAISAREGE